MTRFTLREAAGIDSRFLGDMLVEAHNWAPSRSQARVDLLADPLTQRYVAGWQRPGDAGMIAEDAAGHPIGAAWYRLFPSHAPGFGFVAAGVPEITIGVTPIWRAQGVGREVLHAVLAQARTGGFSRVSLNVDRANHAHRLYVSEGFHTVLSGPESDVMVRILG